MICVIIVRGIGVHLMVCNVGYVVCVAVVVVCMLYHMYVVCIM